MDFSQGRFRVLNEPRGFIRALQWLLAIIAFGTCADYSGTFQFIFDCTTTDDTDPIKVSQTLNLEYPFSIAKSNPDFHIVDTADCTTEMKVTPPGDVSPSASWFVCVGVLSFLYCMLVCFYYIFLETSLRTNDEIPMLNNVDLLVSILFTFFWLTAASSLAWAKGQLESVTNTVNFVRESDVKDFCTNDLVSCSSTAPNFVKLNASIAFGFLNMLVWVGSCWFVWKEASFFKRSDPPATQSPQLA